MTEMSRSQSKAEYGRFAHLFVGGIEWLLSQWQALTGGEETDLHRHAASGLEDPGAAYVPGGAVTIGDRIAETVSGELRVFEATATGTNDPETPFTDFTINLTPLGVTNAGDVDWRYLGIVGQMGWDVVPQLPSIVSDSGGIAVTSSHPWNDPNMLLRLLPALSDPGVPWEAEAVVAPADRVTATVEGQLRVFEASPGGTTGAVAPLWAIAVPGQSTSDGEVTWAYLGTVGGPDWEHPIFVVNSAGDADWYLDVDQGSGFRFNLVSGGVPVSGSGKVQFTADGFKVLVPDHHFEVTYAPFGVKMLGLSTSDPGEVGACFLGAETSGARPLLVSSGP